jgi:hypothetical protein
MLHTYPQLYLIKGRIVSTPPQTFNAEFFDNGKASATLSGRRLLNGNYELFEMRDSISTKYKARLINPDGLKPFEGADSKGFAVMSDVDLQLECVYGLTRATGRGEGTHVRRVHIDSLIAIDEWPVSPNHPIRSRQPFGGETRPICVLRLTTSSNLVSCSTSKIKKSYFAIPLTEYAVQYYRRAAIRGDH